jgi:hypothetical protein
MGATSYNAVISQKMFHCNSVNFHKHERWLILCISFFLIISKEPVIVGAIMWFWVKDYEAKMLQAILMTTFSSSLFVRQWG